MSTPVVHPIKGPAYECLSCGGIYYPEQPGGYYHECANDALDPRNENINDSDIENIHSKAEGKGRKVKMTTAPVPP